MKVRKQKESLAEKSQLEKIRTQPRFLWQPNISDFHRLEKVFKFEGNNNEIFYIVLSFLKISMDFILKEL